MGYNEFLVNRTAKIEFTPANAATVHNSNVVIPAGAVITGMRWCAKDGLTNTGAAGTAAVRVGTVVIAAATALSARGAAPSIVAIATTQGILVANGGVLNVNEGTSSGSTVSGTYTIYVDYIV